MVEKFEFKLVALLLSIAFYIALLFGIYYAIVNDKKEKKDYGFDVKDAIVVNIDSLIKEKPKPIEHIKPKPKPITPPPSPPKTVEQKKPVLPQKEPIKKISEVKPKISDVAVNKPSRDKIAKTPKDLFSTVRSQKYDKIIKEQQKQKEAKASRLKKREARLARKRELREKQRRERQKARAKKAREARKLLQDLQISQPASSSKKKGEEHEYWSFVSDKIMAKWQRTVSTQNGLKGSALIRIDKNGRLTYRNLKLSGNSLFDTKLKVFLDNLEYERFPAYKKAPYIEAVFEFKDKEKGI